MNAPAEVLAQQDAGLRRIALLCDGEVSRKTDGNRDLLYMQSLRFFVTRTERKMDALLWLNNPNATYPTRLYLPEKLGAGLNWHEDAYLLGRQWHTFSWRGVSPNQPLIDILAAHLMALSPPT